MSSSSSVELPSFLRAPANHEDPGLPGPSRTASLLSAHAQFDAGRSIAEVAELLGVNYLRLRGHRALVWREIGRYAGSGSAASSPPLTGSSASTPTRRCLARRLVSAAPADALRGCRPTRRGQKSQRSTTRASCEFGGPHGSARAPRPRTALAVPGWGSPLGRRVPVHGSCASGPGLGRIVGGRLRYGGVMFDVTPFRRVDGAVVLVVYRGDW